VLGHIEKHYGGDEARIVAELANNPQNTLRTRSQRRSGADIERFEKWFNLEDMFELYGSTERPSAPSGARVIRAAAWARSPTRRCRS